MNLQATCALHIAGEGEQRREECIERAVLCLSPLTRLHISVAVPEAAADFVGKIFVDGWNTGIPHVATILIAEKKPALPQIFVVRINTTADVTVSIRPSPCVHVNAFADEPERRASLERFNQSAFCFLVENGLPVNLLRVPNSNSSVPVSAGFVTGSRICPVRRLT